ncbi:MAG: hypothetical protein AB8F95_00140 [Bacteroidia bacterium]
MHLFWDKDQIPFSLLSMEVQLLEYWDTLTKGSEESAASIDEAHATTPWFCLPHMLKAKASGDTIDLMGASMYAPDRARFHEWALAPENSQQANVELPAHYPASSPLRYIEFVPPVHNTPSTGTGPLDSKVQRIVAQQFGQITKVQRALFPERIEQAIKEAEKPSISEQVDIPEILGVKEKPEGLVYKGRKGAFIPIAVSEEQKALFEESTPKSRPQSIKIEPQTFTMRKAEELMEVSVDEQIAKSVAMEETPASETMAKLLAIQGNTVEAIAIYDRLRLANPDKNAYFVAQIEQLN